MAKRRGNRTKPAAAVAGAATVAVADSIVVRAAPYSIATSQARRVELNARNNAELRTNAQNILNMIQDSRPKNTSAAYEPKQKEFKDFCIQKQYHDVDTVTEDKLLLFLVE